MAVSVCLLAIVGFYAGHCVNTACCNLSLWYQAVAATLICRYPSLLSSVYLQNHVVDWTISLNSTIRDAFMGYLADPTVSSKWRMLGGYLVDRASQPLCNI